MIHKRQNKKLSYSMTNKAVNNNNASSADYAVSSSYLRIHGILRVVVILVATYALGMVLAGRVFAAQLFDLLHFGPGTHQLDEKGVSYAIFAFGVLGAVLFGWMILIWNVLDLTASNDSTIRSKARYSLAASVAVWFVIDTGFSIALGEIEHALFNIPFGGLLGIPLYMMHREDMSSSSMSYTSIE